MYPKIPRKGPPNLFREQGKEATIREEHHALRRTREWLREAGMMGSTCGGAVTL